MGNGKGFGKGLGKLTKGGGKGGKGGGKGGKGGGGTPTKIDWKGYNPNPDVIRNPQWMQWYPAAQPAAQASWLQGPGAQQWFQGPSQQLNAAAEHTGSWLDAPGAMLSGSFRLLNPAKTVAMAVKSRGRALQLHRTRDAVNRFAALATVTESDGAHDETEEDAAKQEPNKLSLKGFYNGGRCGCRHPEDRRSNHAICSLHESQRTSFPSWRRGLRDNRKSQMATMAS